MTSEKVRHFIDESTERAAVPVLRASDMLAAEQASGVDPQELMARAGKQAVEAIMARFERQPVTVLCGPGNNGGDGLVIARLLSDAGWPVVVGYTLNPNASAAVRFHHAQLSLVSHPLEQLLISTDLVIDALFGTGLTRPLGGCYEEILKHLQQGRHTVVSIDVVSGISSDTGAFLTQFPLKAEMTVAIDALKPCHVLEPSRSQHGEVLVRSIGLEHSAPFQYKVNHPLHWHYPWPTPLDHKFTRGGLAIISDGHMLGAALLAATAARRIGCGYVTLFVPRGTHSLYSVEPGIILRFFTGVEDLFEELENARHKAFLIGPGVEPTAETQLWVKRLLKFKRPTVLDAGALMTFRGKAEELADAVAGLPVVITPHEGELRRLLPEWPEKDKLALAELVRQTFPCTTVLKGADTIIASSQEPSMYIQDVSTPWLATAGTGDVLSGTIGALLALGVVPHQAAAMAVWMQCAAARIAPFGLIAEDIPLRYLLVLEGLAFWDVKKG